MLWWGLLLGCKDLATDTDLEAEADTDTDADTDSDTDSDTDTDADTDTDTDADTDADTNFGQPSDLPDLVSPLDGQAADCASSEFWQSADMATTFFTGWLDHDGSTGQMTELWRIYPNPNMAQNFPACTVVWTGTAVVSGNLTAEVDMSVDLGQTNCPPNAAGDNIYDGEETYSVTYNIAQNGDGTSEWTFASGTVLGSGHFDSDAATYVTEAQCLVF